MRREKKSKYGLILKTKTKEAKRKAKLTICFDCTIWPDFVRFIPLVPRFNSSIESIHTKDMWSIYFALFFCCCFFLLLRLCICPFFCFLSNPVRFLQHFRNLHSESVLFSFLFCSTLPKTMQHQHCFGLRPFSVDSFAGSLARSINFVCHLYVRWSSSFKIKQQQKESKQKRCGCCSTTKNIRRFNLATKMIISWIPTLNYLIVICIF